MLERIKAARDGQRVDGVPGRAQGRHEGAVRAHAVDLPPLCTHAVDQRGEEMLEREIDGAQLADLDWHVIHGESEIARS